MINKILKYTLAIFTLSFLAECANKHPETIYGIKLGYPAEEELAQAIHDGHLTPSPAGNVMTLSNSAKGSVFYSTYTDDKGKELLESISVRFFSEDLFRPPTGEGVGYLNFEVTSDDLKFIKESYFKKYGVIGEHRKEYEYRLDGKEDKYYTTSITDNDSTYTYYWIGKDRNINLSISGSSCEANYYFTNIQSKELHSEIDKSLNEKRQDF